MGKEEEDINKNVNSNARLFIGRERELSILNEFLTARSASFLVIKGRRRIGKSRLIEEFSKRLWTLYFLGWHQRKEFLLKTKEIISSINLKAKQGSQGSGPTTGIIFLDI